jgi:uncharacterized protein YndB with AHSA1/START domain
MEALMIKHSITTSASRERVWKAITNPKNLSKWHTPLSMSFNALVVGETITFEFNNTSNQGTIAIVEPLERFAYRWQAHPDYQIHTLVTYTLKDTDEGTLITITEEGFEALPAEVRQERIDLNSQGWGIVLDRMKADVEANSQS